LTGLDGRLRATLARIAQHVVAVALAVGAWFGVIAVFAIDPQVLPPPDEVLSALIRQFSSGRFWMHFGVTGTEVVLGFGLGCTVAFLAGTLVAQSRLVERMLYPCVVALESIPKIALAPLFVVWFGFGLTSKVVTTALICFFPMFVNVTQGLMGSSRAQIEVLRAAGAGRLSLLWRLQLPNALPMIFAALNICVILAVIGAVVAEYVGAKAGVGYQLLLLSRQIRTADVFANIVALALMGLLGHALIRLVQRRLVFWDDARTGSAD
jgi:NitT/TauT family transport system permease protein